MDSSLPANIKFFVKRLTEPVFKCIIRVEKGKTSNGYATIALKDSPDLAGGGYLTFCVSTIKNIIAGVNTLNVCFLIATTFLPDYKCGN